MIALRLSREAPNASPKGRSASRAAAPPSFGARLRRGSRWAAFLTLLAVGAFLTVFISRRINSFSIHFFRIRSVRVVGLSDPLDREVASKARLPGLEGRNLLWLDGARLERLVAEHPKVAEAKVVKKYPDSLLIVARERTPAAYVDGGGGSAAYAIDAEGVLMEKLGADGADRGADLPSVSGLDLEGRRLGDRLDSPLLHGALLLFARMQQVNRDLYDRVNGAEIDSARGLTLLLRDNVKVLLGETDPLERMPMLETFLDSRRDWKGLKYIDLRFDGQISYQ
ncbi:MAG: cell division protein FtsQ/DivIB [Candidatus Sumerlaeota bacterium]|nr:cell division protein FtsQ/DivIB [Candidatus Sumerlaeota bacterium]